MEEKIVRCRNCKYCKQWEDGFQITCDFWTDQWDMSTELNAFCSFGELKDGCEYEIFIKK